MSESLGFEGAPEEKIPPGEISPNLYGGETFLDEGAEMSFLQRLQTASEIDGIKWGPAYFKRLQFLENKKREGPTEEQKRRFIELTILQRKGGPEWTPELQKEIKKLYILMDKGGRN